MKLIKIVMFVVATGIFSACKTGDWHEVYYNSPGSDFNFKKGTRVEFIPVDKTNRRLCLIASKLESELETNKNIRVDSENPEYVIALNEFDDNRFINRSIEDITTFCKVEKKENKYEGEEVVKRYSTKKRTTGTLVNIVIYEVNGLIPQFSSEIFINIDDTEHDELIVNKLKNSLLIKPKKERTFFPADSNRATVSDLISMESFDPLKVKEISASVKQRLPSSFDSFVTKFNRGEYKDKHADLELILQDFYIYAICQELADYSAANLQKLFAMHLKIMQITEKEGLAVGCANSLGRIERKWRTLGFTGLELGDR